MSDPLAPPDSALAGFLQSVERTVVDAYDKVLPLLSQSDKALGTTFQEHHRDYADALGKLAGSAAANHPNQTLSLVLAARLQSMSDERSALTSAAAVENELAATYGFALSTTGSPDVVKLIATILPMVSTHAAALAALASVPTAAVFPNGAFETTTVAGVDSADASAGFDPAAFPVV
jgi:hypothetical protein